MSRARSAWGRLVAVTEGRSKRRAAVALSMLVFVLATVTFMPLALAGQRTFIAVDVLEETSPVRDSAAHPADVASPIQGDQAEFFSGPKAFFDDLRSGQFDLWDPNLAGGAPSGVLPFNALLSPLSLGYLFLPAWYAVGLAAALALLVAQAGTYGVLRRVGTSRAVATIGGVAYAFCGVNVVFIHRVSAVFVLPVLLLCTIDAVWRPCLRTATLLALVTAWTWFEGFPAGFVYCVDAALLLGAWLLAREALRHGGSTWRGRLLWALKPVGALAGGLAGGVAVSAITLIPTLSLINASGVLGTRNYTSDAHLPAIQFFGIADLSVYGPLRAGPWWSGSNPVESVMYSGTVVCAALGLGLLAGALGRLRLADQARDLWIFFCAIGVAGIVMLFLGTPLLGIAYRIPGIANNPIGRIRFVVSFAAVVLAALALDALWKDRQAAAARRPVRLVSVLTLIFVLGVAVGQARPFIDAAHAASQIHAVKVSGMVGLGVALLALGVAGVGWRLPRLRVPAAIALVAIVFVQLTYPLQFFTPQAPVDDYYPRTAGWDQLAALTAGKYRFTGGGNAYQPNSNQAQHVPDLRGGAVRTQEFKNLIEKAQPDAFALDSFKLLVPTGKLNLSSPVYDDLAVRYVVVSTGEQPLGTVDPVQPVTDSWLSTTALGTGVPASASSPGPLAGLFLRLRSSGDCGAATVMVAVRTAGREVARSARPASDIDGSYLPFGLAATSIGMDDPYSVTVASSSAACAIDVGVVSGRVAVQAIVEEPGSAVHIVAASQGWFYERQHAWQLVSVHPEWRAFPDQTTELAWASSRGDNALNTAGFVGAAPVGAPATTATLDSSTLTQNGVSAHVHADGLALLVVSEQKVPGWTAAVDGSSTPLVSVDGALLGVFVPAGSHDIHLSYSPTGFKVGTVLSVGTLLVIAAANAAVGTRGRRRTNAS